MSGGFRAAMLAGIPSGYGSRLISLTLIVGLRFSTAWIVARTPLSSTGDELQCASVIVVFFAAPACVTPSVIAEVDPAPIPTTSAAPATAVATRSHERGRRLIPPPCAFSRYMTTTLNLP